MRNIILYTALSLDNYIAKTNGGIDWLFNDQDYGYTQFYNTYKTVLGFGNFMHNDRRCIVFSHLPKPHTDTEPSVTFINQNIVDFVQQLKAQQGKDIWLVGGAQINTLLLNAGLIDQMVLSIHPVLLGNGIPLFYKPYNTTNWVLTNCQTFDSGLVQLTYNLSNWCCEIRYLALFRTQIFTD